MMKKIRNKDDATNLQASADSLSDQSKVSWGQAIRTTINGTCWSSRFMATAQSRHGIYHFVTRANYTAQD
jgi:hypothetical protein